MRKLVIYIAVLTLIISQPGLLLAEEEQLPEEPMPVINLVSLEPLNDQVVALPLGSILPLPRRDPAGEEGPGYQQEVGSSKNAKNIAGLSGSFNVEKFSGAVVYQPDLTLPPGRQNFGPSLKLSYSSSQHIYDSLVGFGWSLEQSYIVRSAKAQNQLYSENQFTLVLGGSSIELAPINLTDGVHGEYGAKIEEQFLKVEFLDDNSWQITDKLGKKYLLGTAAGSRQDNPAGANQIYRWMLTEVRDTNDNFIAYEYYKEAGQIYPRKIVYTGHGQEAGLMEVRFQPFYNGPEQADQRADIHNSHFTQFLVSTRYLLSEVQVLVSNELIRKYNLTYNHGENGSQSLLSSIQRSDYAVGQWSRLPATTFSYQTQNKEWHQTARNEWQVPAIVYDEQGFPYHTSARGTGPLDANGDGWLDYLMVDGRARINPKDNQENEWPGIETGLPERPFEKGVFADLNGDLLPDFIGRFRNQRLGRDETRVLLNNGEAQRWQYSDVWTSQLPAGADPNFLEDLNGDSLADLVQIYHDNQGNDEHEWSAIVHLNNGDGTWTRQNAWEQNSYFNGRNWQAGTNFLDVNNDNLPDLVKTWGTGPQAGVYLNNGNGWNSEASNVWQVPDGQGNGGHLYVERAEIFRNGVGRFADLNNDGWLDIVISYNYQSDYWGETLEDKRVYLNNGNGWVENDDWQLPDFFITGNRDNGVWLDHGVRLLDLNADGLTDIIQGEGRPVQLNQSSAKANLLVSVDNGYGSITSLLYQSSARIRNEQGDYQNPKLAFVLPTVSQVSTADGLGNEVVTNYSYADANYYYSRENVLDSQFAGFGLAIAKTASQVIKTYFHQAGGVDGYDWGEYEDSFYKKGRVYREEVLQDEDGQSILQSVKVNKWLESGLGNSRKFVYQDNAVSYDASQGGQMMQGALVQPDNLNQQAVVAQVSALKDRLSVLTQAQTFSPVADAELLGQSFGGWSKVYYLGFDQNNLQHFQYQVFSGSELGRDDPIEGEGEFAITRPYDGAVAFTGEWLPDQAPDWENVVDEQNGTEVNYNSWNARISNLAFIREGRNRRQIYSIGRIFLPFETSGLPEDITVTRAQLRLTRERSNNGYNLQIVNSEQNPNRQHLDAEDFGLVGDASAGQINDGAPGTNVYELNETGRSWVDPTGWTKLALRADPDFDRQAPQDARENYQDFHMSESEEQNRPMLAIDYYYNNVRPDMPTDLQTEDQANPDDVADQNPEFSAVYNDENQDGQAVAYQIQVIGAGGTFNNPLWDSGQQDFAEAVANGQRTSTIEYGGQALPLDGMQYFWRIRFYDDGVNQNEGLWSTGQDYFYMDGSASPEAPIALQTEARVNPQDLINQTPSFSAVYLDPNPIDLAKWYQLQVDDSQDFSSPVWDSDKTLLNNLLDNGSRSQEITYGSEPLPYDGATYYWRIKFWDDEGENGTEGTWSETGTFSMFDTNDVLADFSAKAVKFHYDFANGNVSQEQGLGKVSAALNGVFLNTEEAAGDEKNSFYEYAEPVQESLHILSAPKTKIIIDPETQASSTVAITYDGLDFGMVQKANPTKEDLKAPQVLYEKTFNNFGLVTQTKDPLNHRTNIAYDAANYYPATTRNHLNQTTRTEYDLATGQIKRITDPNGLIEERDYDAFSRLVEVRKTNPASTNLIALTRYEYHDSENPSWVKQINYPGQWFETSSYTYFDGLGRTIQTRESIDTNNQYRITSSEYDNRGNLLRQSMPYLANGSVYGEPDWNQPYTRYIYDVQNRVTEESVITGQNTYTTVYEYDGWNTLVTDANGKQKKFYRDAYNQLIQTDEYLNGEIYSTRYEYNLLGKITKITDSQNNVRDFTYDTLGRLLSQEEMHRADAEEFGIWTLEYDAASNLIRKTDAKGQVVTYTYDSLNRVLTENFQGADGAEVTYTYDQGSYGKGRLYRVVSPGAAITYTYDKWGRVTKEARTINGRIYNTLWTYNLQSVPTAITYPDSSKVYYSYNKEGLPIRIRTAQPGQSIVDSMPLIDEVLYSPIKQIAQIEYTTNIVSANIFDPNQAYRLTHKTTTNPFNLVVQDLSYTYDAVGNITNLSDQSQTLLAKNTAYEYDDLYRLTGAVVTNSANNADYQQSYGYDIIGNILNKSDVGNYLYEYTNPYQASRVAQADYQYDENGNLTSDSLKAYHYNYLDRLIQVDIDEDNVLYNNYDQAGMRTLKQLTSTKPDPMGGQITYITKTTYPNSLYEEETSGLEGQEQNWTIKKIRHIILGNQTIAHVNVDSQGNVEKTLVFSDHLGSASLLTDDFGRIKTLYDYYPYGGARIEGANGLYISAYRFTGQELDQEINQYYYVHREYDQDIARFNKVDMAAFYQPARFLTDPQQLNFYSYAKNNPVRFIDPTGLLTIIIPGTHYNPDDWSASGEAEGFINSVSKTFNETHETKVINDEDVWSGGDNNAARQKAADYITDYIKNYQFADDEKLNIVGHSHGGNIGILVSQRSDRKIDNLVTLATPARSDYQPNYDNIGRHINAYSTLDAVQMFGGGQNSLSEIFGLLVGDIGGWLGGKLFWGEFGLAGRTIGGAENIDVTQDTSYNFLKAHFNFWRQLNVWFKINNLYQ